MTRADLCTRLRDELDAWLSSDEATAPATINDVDSLFLALDGVLDDCRGFMDEQFSRAKES